MVGCVSRLVLTIFLLTVLDTASSCELSWSRYDEHCYRIFTHELTKFSARIRCFFEGSDLAPISNTEVLDFLAQHVAHTRLSKFWVGLERNKDGELVWFDGTKVVNQSWVKIPEASEYVISNFGSITSAGCFAYDGALVVKEPCYQSFGFICGHKVSNKSKSHCHWAAPRNRSFIGDSTGNCLFRNSFPKEADKTEETCGIFKAHFVDLDAMMKDGLTAFYEHQVLANDGSKYWTGFQWNGTHILRNSGGIMPDQYPIPFERGNGSCITVQFNFTDILSTHLYQTECSDLAYVICADDMDHSKDAPTTTARSVGLFHDGPVMDEPQKNCPEGYNWKSDRTNSYCYWETSFETDQLSWHDAEKYCQGYGGHLASFHAMEEEKIGLSFQYGSLTHPYWIGLSFDTKTETYKWSDGSPLNYTNWAPNHPNHKDKQLRCVAMEAQEKHWVSSLCGILSWFICKVPRRTFHPRPALPTPTPLEPCEKNFLTKSSWYFDGACYFPVVESFSWHRAKQFCENQGASLVSIHSVEELGFLLRLVHEGAMETNRVWIGLNSFGSDGNFQWTDYTAVDFTHFAPDEPNNFQNQEKCCNMNTMNGQWNDENCNAALGFVCKRMNDTSFTPVIPVTQDPRIGNCKKGWIAHLDRCYYIGGRREKDRANWTEATEFCLKNGGYLTSVRDSIDQGFLSYLLQTLGDDAWIGLHDTIQSGRYYWLDNSDVQYTNWAPGEPSFFGIMEDCVKMVYNHLESGVWKDEECHHKIGFICQMAKDPKLPPPPSDRGVNCVHPEGWLKLDTMCFKMFEGSPQTWYDAENVCKKEGGHLVSISDQRVKAVVSYLASEVNQPFFIGLKYNKDSKSLSWLNDYPVMLSNWEKNEPSLMTEDTCFSSTSEGYWKKASCNERMPFACQITGGNPIKKKSFTGECPPSTRLWVPGSGSFCYIVDNEFRSDWFTSNLMCFRYGSHLISIHSMQEIEDIKKLIKPGVKSIHLGLIKNKKGGFAWTDDTPVDFENWDEGQPAVGGDSNLLDQCVEMMADTMKWRMISCLSKKHYACRDTKETLVIEEIVAAEYAAEHEGLSTAAICSVVFSILIGVVLLVAAVLYRKKYSRSTPQFRRQGPNQSVSFENALYDVRSNSMEFNDESKS